MEWVVHLVVFVVVAGALCLICKIEASLDTLCRSGAIPLSLGLRRLEIRRNVPR